jgi:Glycosyl transferase family 2
LTICLNMIVKNEAHVIERCLSSLRPWIDHWVIVDTGSTDGTQALIQKILGGIPGQLHERPWVNFGHNRNEALQLAKHAADYLLFIDADEWLALPPGFVWPKLSSVALRFDCLYADTRYQRNALVSTRLPWRWQGVIHEYLDSSAPHQWELLAGPQIVVHHDGARARDPSTYLRDIAVLEQALQSEPHNTRYQFYLAQSLRDAGQLGAARERYLQRASAGGWEEERWCAQFRAAQLAENLGLGIEQLRSEYLQAYQSRPTRAEPLYELARLHRTREEFALAHLFAAKALSITSTLDILFVDQSVYQWRVLDEYSLACFWGGHMEDGRVAMKKLLSQALFPASEAARMAANKLHFKIA